MKQILSASEMKACDKATIENYGVPSLVLMERAALAVCEKIREHLSNEATVGIICGPGNNGGDGVAIARIMHTRGLKVKALVLGNFEKFSEQLVQEIGIAKNYNVCLKVTSNFDSEFLSECQLLVDAMFGIGLTRGLSGEYETAAKFINDSGKHVIAVDIPSGFDTDSGKLLGEVGVNANETVTFAFVKKGILLGDCKKAAGAVMIADVGIYRDEDNASLLLDDSILARIPKRELTANKGTCGKVLVIAGSESIYGACYLSAYAALVTGSGLVKVYTHKNNIDSIQQNLPEAMYTGYEDFNKEELIKEISWADTVIIGPGLGTSELSRNILHTTLEKVTVPVVIDADGLNLLAEDLALLDKIAAKVPVIITPHLKEMERLCGTAVKEINYSMEKVAGSFAKQRNCTVVLKNHTTLISNVNTIYYCTSGNEALATPGSGDVLAGIIGALLGQKMTSIDAASAGAYLHGKAGAKASESTGVKGLLARDIINSIGELL